MKIVSLNGFWRLTGGGYDVLAAVPGSVVSALLENKLIPDPYYGDNEFAVQSIFDHDYVFSRQFHLEQEDLNCSRVLLRCDGLDTVCRIVLNGIEIASVDNMHLQYCFDVGAHLHAGDNEIRLEFTSPVEYSKTLDSPMGKAFASMRKAHCMFGWDWGICLPDSGIWRDIFFEFVNEGRLTDLNVRQHHAHGCVTLELQACAELLREAEVRFAVTDPDGVCLCERIVRAEEWTNLSVKIEQPRLWWPAGYGEQPLYQVSAELISEGIVADSRALQIGLRTVSLNRGPNNEGDYQFFVNGVPVYIKGANIVIEDAIISRSGRERWEQMVLNAVKANYNTLRVWGGAYYPPDVFFELCDRNGIMIYQDFMFACRFYWPSPEFLKSISEEVRQTVIRLRNHPCLCQWCGNNEADFFFTAFTSLDEETAAARRMFHKELYTEEEQRRVTELYSKTFLDVIPKIVQGLSPEVGYVHSSPSVGDKLGVSDMFEYFPKGDAHYYHHVNDDAPYQKLEQFKIRLLSEFGFQSYPSMKTLREYLPADKLEPYSKEMLVHQKFVGGNEVIELYLSRDFFVPQDFEQYVYMSQMMAGEILRYTAEHMRRDRDYSRGLLLWQHNDCWPVVSWAGVDYRGRWKGQQYYAKRFFSPVLVSAKVEGGKAKLYVINDRPYPVSGELYWALYEDNRKVGRNLKEITLPPHSSAVYDELDVPCEELLNRSVLCYGFWQQFDCLSQGSMLFVEQKDYVFEMPLVFIEYFSDGEEYRIEFNAYGYVKGLFLDLEEGDALFSDNFFDLEPGMRRVISVRKDEITGVANLDDLKRQLKLMCVNQVVEKLRGEANETQ